MLAAAAAACLTAALVIDVSRGGNPTAGALWFAVAGIAFLGLGAIFPPGFRRPRPDRRQPVSDTPQHHAVLHPVHLRIRQHQGQMGRVGKANDWLASHLAVVFGVCWTIWLFFTVPLIAPYLGATAEGKIFFYSSGWIQLFALPLMVYVGNKLQRSSDAQSEVMRQALSHIATVSDQNKILIEQNTELTAQVHALVQQPKAAAKRLATPTERGKRGSGS